MCCMLAHLPPSKARSEAERDHRCIKARAMMRRAGQGRSSEGSSVSPRSTEQNHWAEPLLDSSRRTSAALLSPLPPPCGSSLKRSGFPAHAVCWDSGLPGGG